MFKPYRDIHIESRMAAKEGRPSLFSIVVVPSAPSPPPPGVSVEARRREAKQVAGSVANNIHVHI